MRKILMLSTLFGVVSLNLLSNEGQSNQAIMQINAKVLKPLTVKADKDLEFGDILPGTFNQAFSSFSLQGESNSKVRITFEGVKSEGDSFRVPLKNGNNTFTILFNCTQINKPGEWITPGNDVIELSDSGKQILNIAASTDVSRDQAPGIYSGNFTLKARYN